MQFEEAYIGAHVKYTGDELLLETTGQIITIGRTDHSILVKFPDESSYKNICSTSRLHSAGGRDGDGKSLWFSDAYSIFGINNLEIIDVEVINLEEE